MENYKKTIGSFGENLAKDFLIRHGYKIINNNLRFGKLEIDLIAEQNKITVFVEVKTRQAISAGPAEDALKLSQIKNLKRAISAYCRKNKINIEQVRLDFISIDIKRSELKAKIKHFKDIF
jgi:putative endonuclease